MLTKLENYYFNLDEPLRGCLLALRDIILACDERVTPEWKYGMPFFYLDGKMFCYFWNDKKTGLPYIGFMNGNKMKHPSLEAGTRARVRVFPVNPEQDIPIDTIRDLLNEAITVA